MSLLAAINFVLVICLYVLIYFFQPIIWGLVPPFVAVLFIFCANEFKKSLKFTLIMFLLLLITGPCIFARNLVQNGGFEQGESGWIWISQWHVAKDGVYERSRVDGGIISGVKRAGYGSFGITNNQEKGPQRYGFLSQQIKVWPKAVYDISFYVKGKIEQESLWICVSDEWSKDSARYYVPAGTYNEWSKIGPIKLETDDSYSTFFKIISGAPSQYYVDDIKVTLDIFGTIKKWFGGTR